MSLHQRRVMSGKRIRVRGTGAVDGGFATAHCSCCPRFPPRPTYSNNRGSPCKSSLESVPAFGTPAWSLGPMGWPTSSRACTHAHDACVADRIAPGASDRPMAHHEFVARQHHQWSVPLTVPMLSVLPGTNTHRSHSLATSLTHRGTRDSICSFPALGQ